MVTSYVTLLQGSWPSEGKGESERKERACRGESNLSPSRGRYDEVGGDVVVAQVLVSRRSVTRLHLVLPTEIVQSRLSDVNSSTTLQTDRSQSSIIYHMTEGNVNYVPSKVLGFVL